MLLLIFVFMLTSFVLFHFVIWAVHTSKIVDNQPHDNEYFLTRCNLKTQDVLWISEYIFCSIAEDAWNNSLQLIWIYSLLNINLELT